VGVGAKKKRRVREEEVKGENKKGTVNHPRGPTRESFTEGVLPLRGKKREGSVS